MSGENLASLGDLAGLCKRRGFLFQSSEIYGGVGGCYDYGPLGVELKRNLQAGWWKAMTDREDVVGLDSSILMAARVWEASGHVEGFSDPLVDCKKCKARFREDQVDTTKACPECGARDSWTPPRQFNLMFKTRLGPVEDSSSVLYLRPETAQGIFVNFSQVQSSARMSLPFGIAQIGKAFRNEITPGHFIFRTREFEQMEMQYFVKPGDQGAAFEEWRETRLRWHTGNGIRPERLRWHPHPPDELAHYADMAEDIEYEFPHGWGEVEGIHSRTDFDLGRHEEHSGKSLKYVDQADGNRKYLPHVVETSVGSDRCLLAVLCDAYRRENPGEKDERVVLKLRPSLAPVKAAVLPLMRKDGLEEIARRLFGDLQSRFKSEIDMAGSIGKRYRRQDEIGTPFCVTVDYTTKEDGTVTVRERDSMAQERVPAERVAERLDDRLRA